MNGNNSFGPVELAQERDFSLGLLAIHPSSREISIGATTEALEPKVMQVLVSLARRQGAVLSRDDLVKECWSGRVVSDDAINRCIARLRRVSETHGGFNLETIPRIGYRLTQLVAATDRPLFFYEATSSKKWLARHTLVVLFATIAVVAVIGRIYQWPSEQHSDRYTVAEQDEIVARVLALVSKDQLGAAFTAARPIMNDKRVRALPEFASAWKQIVTPMRPVVAEPGAAVYFKVYEDERGDWIGMGSTPLAEFADAPRAVLRIKVEKPGYRTGYFVVANPGPSVENDPPLTAITSRRVDYVPLPLIEEHVIADDMVIVPHTNYPAMLPSWTPEMDDNNRLDLPSFAIDREETTNRRFKEFVDAGGYVDAKYWEGLQFADSRSKDARRALSFDEARKRFVDSTGRPGPAGWQLSTYPTGEEDLPVGGISWYEAAAYAKFRGKELPTVHHWARAAFAPYDPLFNVSPSVSLNSRFISKGPVGANEALGLGPWGTIQMAGNVREWVWNSADGEGLSLGGAWSDYANDDKYAATVDRMQRSELNGVRLMKSLSGSISPELKAPIHLGSPESKFRSPPVSDEVFAIMLAQFDKAKPAAVDTKLEVAQEAPLWIAEEAVVRYADKTSATFYIVRPKHRAGKMQPVIFAPAQICCVAKRPNRTAIENVAFAEFIVNSGRAMVIPIWSGSYERFVATDRDPKMLADTQRRTAIDSQQDLSRALDYLATRDDIDVDRIGFVGVSRGASRTVIATALEPRVKAIVLISGGIQSGAPPHPMIHIVNYAPRIRAPLLMINGRLDHIYPYKESQQRMFELFGTPADRKRHIVYDTGHYNYPPNSTARDATDWFDKYLGAVH